MSVAEMQLGALTTQGAPQGRYLRAACSVRGAMRLRCAAVPFCSHAALLVMQPLLRLLLLLLLCYASFKRIQCWSLLPCPHSFLQA